MSSGERPMGAAKGKQSDTEALCQPPPPPGLPPPPLRKWQVHSVNGNRSLLSLSPPLSKTLWASRYGAFELVVFMPAIPPPKRTRTASGSALLSQSIRDWQSAPFLLQSDPCGAVQYDPKALCGQRTGCPNAPNTSGMCSGQYRFCSVPLLLLTNIKCFPRQIGSLLDMCGKLR